jgi:hypothetical protein
MLSMPETLEDTAAAEELERWFQPKMDVTSKRPAQTGVTTPSCNP